MKPSPTSVSAASRSSTASGIEGAVVADHLELDPLGLECLAGEAGGADRVAGGVAAGGVGQGEEAEAVEDVEHRAAGIRVDAAQGDGDHLRPGGGQRRSICSRERKPPVPAIRREDHSRPPSRQRRPLPGSRRGPRPGWPSASGVDPHSPRGTTSPSSATATPRGVSAAPASRTASARLAPSGSSTGLAVQLDPHRPSPTASSRFVGHATKATRRVGGEGSTTLRRSGASRMPLR